MSAFSRYSETIHHRGFCIIPEFFKPDEIHALTRAILFSKAYVSSAGGDEALFSIRRFLHEVPAAMDCIFTDKFNYFIDSVLGKGHFVVKSVYFDKPAQSNWFVPYHQDLTIPVKGMAQEKGFGKWTKKPDYFNVQPPLGVLETKFTIRIHLDHTGEKNGALRVIPTSHNRGVVRPEGIDWNMETENICAVPAGGIMVMSPLLLHASHRTTNFQRRRVIHIEFSDQSLPASMEWSEKLLRPRNFSYTGAAMTD